ncbi:MAG: integrase [Candidatus ainarchaeum sp.]|nr:integrase [Candidatus ainarchaeum sp.]
MVSLIEWKDALINANYSKGYQKKIIAKIPLIFQKHTYTFQEFLDVINVNNDKINKDETAIKMIRLILNYCEKKELLTTDQLAQCRKKIKTQKSGVDNHVPTDQEIQQTISQLSPNNKLMYLVYLMSGVRKVELDYLIKNFSSLKAQQFEGFVKISMNYLRKTKNSYFCYLPLEVYSKLSANYKQLSVSNLEREIKRKKLIPIKYCRKWFYTKCIELGIPESIADYYQGRTGNSIGSNHYLSRQLLADKNYSEIVRYFNSFIH